MSNLATVKVEPGDNYINLGTLASISWVADTIYTMQALGPHGFTIMESPTQPTEGGFTIEAGEKFNFKAGTDDVWVKNPNPKDDVYINIAD